MAKKQPRKHSNKKSEWAQRIKLTPEESRQRMIDFAKRKDAFVAAIRKGQKRKKSD